MIPNREYIVNLAIENGWTQAELAERMSVSRSIVCYFFALSGTNR